MTQLYPLRFRPILKRYIWGGRRLGAVLNKPLGDGDDYAESWEVCDRPSDQSIVAAGGLAGTSLGELVKAHGAELLGRHAPVSRFPLLLKFLDCNQKLSVQVHPNDAQAARLDPPDLGKTEAWYILDARPGSVLYAGLKRGFDRPALERELARGTVELCLHRVEARAGDCVFVPAGAVHALGDGLLVAEIQQSSDTTYRLHDWNRVGADGRPRPLHIEQSLEVIDFDRGPLDPVAPQPTREPGVERLVVCDKFVLERWTITSPRALPRDDRCRILAVADGSLEVEGDAAEQPLVAGGTLVVPAACGGARLSPAGSATALVAYLP